MTSAVILVLLMGALAYFRAPVIAWTIAIAGWLASLQFVCSLSRLTGMPCSQHGVAHGVKLHSRPHPHVRGETPSLPLHAPWHAPFTRPLCMSLLRSAGHKQRVLQ